MSDDPAAGHPEIVIVRRRGGDDMAAAKGGAWKIAYADFVTAMMAFFLVMWLINASNEETRAQVASYFNPIKLTDSSTGARGLKDKKEPKAAQNGEASDASPPSKADVAHEAEIMANPGKALDRIAAAAKPEGAADTATAGSGAEAVAPAPEKASNPETGDPFDPSSQKSVPPASASAPPQVPGNDKHQPQGTKSADSNQADPKNKSKAKPDEKKTAEPTASPLAVPEAKAKTEVPAADSRDNTNAAAVQAADRQDEAAKIAAEIAAKLGTDLDKLPESVEVKMTDEGTLISLTDRQSFGMFKTGSAEPEPELVKLVEAIAGVLAGRPGYIVIRGHTDSKPYRNKRYDNWQLSTARAHLAQYILVRGGLDESRIRRIEGLADREPRNAGDPQAPENRRIEILLGLRVK